ncbi:MAG TPA: oligosaccharide flippase family protein [Cyclobacteriaceae bacterium]|nr:oligosaccharide flippase family protein [Cyclobacteriaceae bacterium]
MGLAGGLTKDTLNYGLGQVLPKAIGFLLIPLYMTYLSPEEFGLVDLAGTVGAFMMVTMRLGVPNAITRFYFDHSGSALRDYITSIYWFIIIISVATSLIFLAAGYWGLDWMVPGLPFWPFFVLSISTAFFNSNSEIQRKLLQVRRKSAYTSALNVTFALSTIALSIFLVVVMDWGALGIVVASTFAAFIFFIQAQVYLHRDLGGTLQFSRMKESFRFGIVLLPYHVYGHFAPIVTKSILSATGSLAAVGVLAIASKFTQPLTILITAFGAAFTPNYLEIRARNEPTENVRLGRLIQRIWLGACMLFVAFFLYADLFSLFATNSYSRAGDLIKLLSLGFLPQLFYVIFSHELFFRKENTLSLLINLIGISLGLLLSWLLVQPWHEVGAGLAVIIPSVSGGVLMYYFTRRKLVFDPHMKRIMGLFLLTQAVAALDYFVIGELEGVLWRFAVKTALFAALLVALYLADTDIQRGTASILKRLMANNGK